MRIIIRFLLAHLIATSAMAQLGTQQKSYSHADTLRGTITPERDWWDVLHYDLHVRFNAPDSSITGYNIIQYRILKTPKRMQIDLMDPLRVDSIVQQGRKQKFMQDGNTYFIELTNPNEQRELTVYYHGRPRVARRPPWDGGVIWAKDQKGRPWISIACQGLGASVWYPCKDHQADEPDSARISITHPDNVTAVANGRLRKEGITHHDEFNGHEREFTQTWEVRNPINNYNIIPYIGAYIEQKEIYQGEKGNLDVSYWVLDYNATRSSHHLKESVQKTLKNLEYWFGPYPFYEDGYKIVDSPHLGMEHQSAIAYGNGYQNGYLGHDLSGTGWGLKWDFIVVHESAHEWFGNNITTKDLADMWVHESFANYSETLFTTSEYGVEAGNDYVIGSRRHIQNDVPIIGPYNVNEEGSGDMYYKGGNMLHMIRQVVNDDEKFRQVLRGLTKDFYHMTVTTREIEAAISKKTEINFSKVFDQYLRTIQIPVLSYSITEEKGKPMLRYSWTNCVQGFDMPVKVTLYAGKTIWLKATTTEQLLPLSSTQLPEKIVDRNFYVDEKRNH